MHQVDVPLDCQQFIDPPFLLLTLGVPGVLLGKQGLDLRCQCLDGVDAILQEPQFFIRHQQICPGIIIAPPDFFCYLFAAVWCTFSFRARQYTAAHPTVFLYAVSVGGWCLCYYACISVSSLTN